VPLLQWHVRCSRLAARPLESKTWLPRHQQEELHHYQQEPHSDEGQEPVLTAEREFSRQAEELQQQERLDQEAPPDRRQAGQG
jgi:hypothetical protein